MLPISTAGRQAVVVCANDRRQHFWTDNLPQWLHNNIDQLASANASGAEVYYTPGGFSQSDTEHPITEWRGRSAANCVEHSSIFIDIDFKDYSSPDSCRAAIHKFIESEKVLPPSTIVFTGGGYHLYWIADEPIPLDVWQRMAYSMVTCANAHGLVIDRQCTIDRARMLRLPGFINNKRGEQVDIVLAGETYTQADIATMLVPHITMGPVKHTRSHIPIIPIGLAPSGAVTSTDWGGPTPDDLPSWDAIDAVSRAGLGCGALQWALQQENHAQVDYALWTGHLSIAQHTDDPEAAVTALCAGHSEFDVASSLAKAASFDGPRRCESLGPQTSAISGIDHCASCQHSGRLTSPIRLGAQSYIAAFSNSTNTSATSDTCAVPARLELPFPYTRRADKPGVFIRRKNPDTDEWEVPDTPLMREDISCTLVQRSKAGAVASFTYTHPVQGVQVFDIPLSALTSPRSDVMGVTLADNFVDMSMAAINQAWRAEVSRYLQTIVNAYTNQVKASAVVHQFGPMVDAPDSTFVYGNLCYRAGESPALIVPDADTVGAWVSRMATPATTAEAQAHRDNLISTWNVGLETTIGGDKFRPDQFILMTGFACALAPFIAPARQRGGLIIPHSTQAGSGKTTMVARAVQMYVSGDDGFVVPDSTKMAFLEKYVAVAGAMPVVLDEVMKKRGDDGAEMLADLALNSTNRKPRERLNGAGTSVSWQSWFYGTTNPDPLEAVASVGGSAQGAMSRILSLKVDPNRFGTGIELVRRQRAEAEFSDWSRKNANVVGQRWIEQFMQNLPNMRERYIYWTERMATEMPDVFTDANTRFPVTIVACTMVAAEAAEHMGLHPFSTEQIYTYARTLLQRSVVQTNDVMVTSATALGDLMASSIGETLFIGGGRIMDNRVPAHEVGIRVEAGHGGVMVYVGVTFARAWCRARRIAFDILTDSIGDYQITRRNIADGTYVKGGTVKVMEFWVSSDDALGPTPINHSGNGDTLTG